jgi:TRAP transporter 4TM/12TM fusion protein
MGGSVLAAAYLIGNLDAIVGRAGAWSTTDLLVGIVAVVTLLEASRRVLGWAIALIGALFVAYAYLGPFLPGLLGHGGYSTRRIVGQLYLGQEGIYGIPLGVAATFVFVFILFGALLEVTGAGRFFIDLAYAVTGRQRGGPAKAAVLASASMGSVSGSAIGNVVTSGSFTIPLMKRTGYRPEEAGGVEAAASTGGQVLPPVMGAGAFLIAEYTGLPYLEVVKGALIPALLYMGTVFLFVHLVAASRDLGRLPEAELPRLGPTLGRGWHYLLALVVLVGALVMDLSVARVGFLACVAVGALAALRAGWDRASAAPAEGREEGNPVQWLARGAERLLDAFVLAGRNTLPVSLACAVAGIIVGIVGLTGLGLKFSTLMLSLAQGSLLLALLLLIVASLVLGMGLPVTASYVVLIVLAGPALVSDFGLPVLVAHLVVFWYSQDSNVTPPVCLAAYAAAGIARSDPLKTGLHAWKYAKGLYLVPLLMVVHPELVLGGSWPVVAGKSLVSMAALAAFAAALEGYAIGRIRPAIRVLLLLCAATAFHPSLAVGMVGVGGAGVVLLVSRPPARRRQHPGPQPASGARWAGGGRESPEARRDP